eukprot:7053756-Pyramimonas_sp.AAC.1
MLASGGKAVFGCFPTWSALVPREDWLVAHSRRALDFRRARALPMAHGPTKLRAFHSRRPGAHPMAPAMGGRLILIGRGRNL